MTPSTVCFTLPYIDESGIEYDESGIEYSVTYNLNKPDAEISIMAHDSIVTFPLYKFRWLHDALNEISSYEYKRQRELENT